MTITDTYDTRGDGSFATDGVSTGSNQIGSPNFAYGPDGTFRGQNRQAARTAQLSLQFEF